MKILHFDYRSDDHMVLTTEGIVAVYNPSNGVLQVADVDLISSKESEIEEKDNVKS